eukprot:7176547-Pyramimonas_sp.AAC.1
MCMILITMCMILITMCVILITMCMSMICTLLTCTRPGTQGARDHHHVQQPAHGVRALRPMGGHRRRLRPH